MLLWSPLLSLESSLFLLGSLVSLWVDLSGEVGLDSLIPLCPILSGEFALDPLTSLWFNLSGEFALDSLIPSLLSL